MKIEVPQLREIACYFCIAGLASAQTQSLPPAAKTAAPLPVASAPRSPETSLTVAGNVEPVVIVRARLEDKVLTLRLAPKIATSIRMPEPVNSVVVGDPEAFLVEHSEHEPDLVTVKPAGPVRGETNLLITTTRGHQLNILLVSAGETAARQPVDVLLKYEKPVSGSFLVEENASTGTVIAETRKLTVEGNAPGENRVTVKPVSLETAAAPNADSSEGLNKLLERQKQASLPELYGQKPGTIPAGARVKAGVSEVLDRGGEVAVLFSVLNPAKHAIAILPPQLQLGGKIKKKRTTAEQLPVAEFRLSASRLAAGQRADGVLIFARPAFKQSNETLYLQVADSAAVDKPALAPIGFGIGNFRGGSANGNAPQR